MRKHLGTRFKVWNRRQLWFWFVPKYHGNSGAIGTAPTEADAVREACSSIEEMAAQRNAVVSGRSTERVPWRHLLFPCEAVIGWLKW